MVAICRLIDSDVGDDGR